MKEKKNLTINKRVLEMADDLIKADGHDGLVSLVESLIREKYHRLQDVLREPPPPPYRVADGTRARKQ